MAAAAQDWWKTTVNPETGDYFADYNTANAWAMNKGGKAASAGFNTASPATTTDDPWSAPWNWGSTTSPDDLRFYDGSVDFTVGKNDAGVYDWGGGWGGGQPNKLFLTEQNVGGTTYHPGDIVYQGEAYDIGGGKKDTRHEGQWSPTTDYGLGSQYVGVMPIAHDAKTGQPVKFFALTAGGGGQTFDTADEAKAAVEKYKTWSAEYPSGGKVAKPSVATGGTGGGSSVLQTNGELLDPGYGEKAFEDMQGFYKGPTEQRKKWDQMKNQPSEQEQQWNKYEGVYANPGTEQSELWGNWESLFSNPSYLDDYYRREGQKAQTTLDRKAASGGWGDSGAAARATANIDRDFADRALLAKGQWAQQGMGLAGQADSSMNTKAVTGMGLAGAADKGRLDNLAAAGNVDQGELAKATSYGVAAGNAQNLKQGRLTGGLNAQQGIADDMANLSSVFYSQADSQKFATDMAAIQTQYQQGNLTLQQAVSQAQEALAGMQVASQTALNSYILGKLTAGKGVA